MKSGRVIFHYDKYYVELEISKKKKKPLEMRWTIMDLFYYKLILDKLEYIQNIFHFVSCIRCCILQDDCWTKPFMWKIFFSQTKKRKKDYQVLLLLDCKLCTLPSVSFCVLISFVLFTVIYKKHTYIKTHTASFISFWLEHCIWGCVGHGHFISSWTKHPHNDRKMREFWSNGALKNILLKSLRLIWGLEVGVEFRYINTQVNGKILHGSHFSCFCVWCACTNLVLPWVQSNRCSRVLPDCWYV